MGGIYTDALESAEKRIRMESPFRFRTILVNGKPHDPLICEKRMARILEFKGTGEKRYFLDIYKEIEEMALREMLRAWGKGDIKHTPWIDEYIIQNNIQVIFGKDDVKINPLHRRKLA